MTIQITVSGENKAELIQGLKAMLAMLAVAAAAPAAEPTQEEEAPAPAARPAAKPATQAAKPTPAAQKGPDPKVLLKDKLRKVLAEKGRPKVVEILKAVGAKDLDSIPADKYAETGELADAALAAEDDIGV